MEYKFNEKNIIEQVQRYIDGTYERHYAQGKYQATDMIIDAGHGKGFCMGNIMKYAMRCGKKKDGDPELDLLKILNKRPDEMSGGERQRVSVARSLINNPKIVFADEPSGNLDSANSKNLYSLFYELRKKKECSFLIVTHDLKFADMADRKIVLNDGKIIKWIIMT